MPPQLIGLRGEQANKTFPLGDAPITFGRNPDNTIVLTGGRASRRHAEVRRDGADYVLADLGSSNGTYVNGQRLSGPHRLRPGDTFDVGDDTFRFDAPQPAVDKTILATPAPISAPPTVPAGQEPTPPPTPVYQPPVQPPVQPPPVSMSTPGHMAYGDQQPSIPPAPAAPKKGGIGRTLLIVLGVLGLVLVVGCIGAAVVINRVGNSITSTLQTSVPAGTPRPTSDSGPSSNNENGNNNGAADGGAEWTVLVYLDGDNNLERDAMRDFNEMELAGSSDSVNVVVQLDRIHGEGSEDDTSNGDWDGTKRFLIQQDDDEEEFASQELEDMGELNMGDPQTLADFVTWGVEQYPAQRYALILWDHGSSWAGIAFDDTSDQKGITLPELDAALRTAQSQTGVEKFDLIGFDACLMAQIDVLQTIEPYGSVAVASAELEPNDGWAWDTWLRTLYDDPAQDTPAVAQAIVDSYQEYYQNGSDDTVTLSAFDLTKIGAVSDGLNTLSDAMIADLGNSYQAIAQARSSVAAYSQPKPETFSAVDLGDFARLVERQGAEGEVASSAQTLGQLIEEARIAEWNGGFHSNSTGMSVFFPQVQELYPDFYEEASPLPQTTSWGSFLKEFYTAGEQQVSAPEISNLDLSSATVGFNNPATLTGSIGGKDIGFVFFFTGVPNADRSGVELTDIDYIYPPGSSPNGEVPDWEDGSYDVRATLDGARWALSNGAETIPVLLGPTKYGTDLYGVEGIYTIQQSGEQISAGLLFQVSQNQATLVRIYGFPKGQKQESQPYEILSTPGDTFTAFLRTYTIQDGRPVPDFNEGETITIGDAPLAALRVPANSGEYVAGFLVRDISGRFNYDYVDITVDNSGAGQVNTQPEEPQTDTPGTQAGSLAFDSADGKFALEYPDGWETYDTGKSQIYFYDPAETSMSFVSVEYLALNESSPEQANQALVDAYEGILAKESDFQRGETSEIDIAGQTGLAFKYTYTNADGLELSGAAIIVTSPNTGLSYVITVQSLTSDFETETATFNIVLDSFRME